MKRLIFVTGKWSTILSVAFLKSRGDCGKFEDTLVHISHVADEAYIESFDKFCRDLWGFSNIKCINYCVYQDATAEGYTNGSLHEKPDQEKKILLREQLGDVVYDELVVPHLFGNASRIALELNENARAFCIEEGMNSYFRHHSKSKLGNNERYFLSRLEGYVSFNFLGLEPLFDFGSHGVPIIVPPISVLRELIEGIKDQEFSLPFSDAASKVLFIGQFARDDMPEKTLFEHYVASISLLLALGASVFFLKHPRDSGGIATALREVFAGQKLYVFEAPDVPAEKIAGMTDWLAVVSYASSALITIQALYGIRGFVIDSQDGDELKLGNGDFVNARNFCVVVTPFLGSLERSGYSGGFEAAVDNIWSSFKPQPEKIKALYQQADHKKGREFYLKLTEEQLQRRIQANPYNSALWAAKAAFDERHASAIKSALTAIVLNPLALTNYCAFGGSILRPLCAPMPMSSQDEVKRLASERPLSARALYSNANLLEQEGQLVEALKFRMIALITHPWKLSAYVNIYRWYRKLRLRELRKHRESRGFLKAWDRRIRRLEARGRKLKRFPGQSTRVAAVTFRPDKGYTGGPGGVLALQKAIVGHCAAGLSIDYFFSDGQRRDDLYADIISGATYALELSETRSYSHFIAHDLGVAFGLALAQRPYVLFWHMQGSFITQNLNFGHDLPEPFVDRLKSIERIAMQGAKAVVFPSDGARDMYFADEHCATTRSSVSVGKSIYNTILPDTSASRRASTRSNLPTIDGLTFVSVGTLTKAKGQDQFLDFLEKALPNLSQKVRWICIGDGVMREEIVGRAAAMEASYANFEFCYLGKIPHADVMNVLRQSDIYVMLHRISIFDFATLEAMSNGCAIMLSKLGGNIDFNKANNVIFPEDIPAGDYSVFDERNIRRLKQLNRTVLDDHFSAVAFKVANVELVRSLTAVS